MSACFLHVNQKQDPYSVSFVPIFHVWANLLSVPFRNFIRHAFKGRRPHNGLFVGGKMTKLEFTRHLSIRDITLIFSLKSRRLKIKLVSIVQMCL